MNKTIVILLVLAVVILISGSVVNDYRQNIEEGKELSEDDKTQYKAFLVALIIAMVIFLLIIIGLAVKHFQ